MRDRSNSQGARREMSGWRNGRQAPPPNRATWDGEHGEPLYQER